MDSEKAFYAVIAGLLVWLIQKISEGVANRRHTMRAQFVDTSQLLGDIRSNLRTTRKFVDAFENDLAGDPCPFEAKLQADEKYYIFSTPAESTIEVFQKDAVQRYSHLDSDLFDKIKLFYDLQKVISATLIAAMTDNFKLLHSSRKISVARQLLGYLQESIDVGESCLAPLNAEVRAIHTSKVWKLLLLSHRPSGKAKGQSEDGVT